MRQFEKEEKTKGNNPFGSFPFYQFYLFFNSGIKTPDFELLIYCV
jgi:hypothetical protein